MGRGTKYMGKVLNRKGLRLYRKGTTRRGDSALKI